MAATIAGATPAVDFQDIRLEEKVGHGSYGVVYKATWRNQLVAVKEFGASAEQKAIETEVKQLSRVKHVNIIALYGLSSYQQSTYLIMEYAEGGSLHNFLHGKVQPAYSLAHAMSWALQCAEGVAYLHAMSPKPLIHRDLKPLNLLLTNKGRHLKICDFGTVADKSSLMTNNRGSAAWMAPEVFEGSKYTEKCDIFSWAIVLWEVLSRKQPFKEIDNTYSIMWKIHKGERPPLLHNCPKRIEDLMTACWKTTPEERPSMTYVVKVMNEIIKDYSGADKPLEYTFINQQIVTKDGDGTMNESAHYDVLDTNNLSPNATDSSVTSTQLTPTNPRRTTTTNTEATTTSSTSTTNTSNTSTPTNAGNIDNNAVFQTTPKPTTTSQVPQLTIVTSTTWDAIPEEDSVCETRNDSFNLSSSKEATKRLESIRNSMMQSARTPMSELTLVVEPNDFDQGRNDSCMAKSDGKERLTVTDTKPVIMTAPSHTLATDLSNNNNNNNNNHSSSSTTTTTTTTGANDNNDADNNDEDSDRCADMEENDGTDQSLAEMLDPELQPVLPIPNNAESQAIYRDHRHMAKEYLAVDTSLYYAQDFKEKLILQMDGMEREDKKDLLRKIKHKEDLQDLYNSLRQQWQKRPPCQALNMHLPGGGNNSNSVSNTDVIGSNLPNRDREAEDGWVVIAPISARTNQS
ncbi:mitogen-activated protein kinase kinase kinase 7 [Scaptodrosophila lebanonensis]|uniref:Mitogen-activated protein kinase kinase kinase 7 n=1 Tax=Drosophila lebanonensis TaxID=7225 RepID=A0A6J2TVQ0_DROLE|nr:mitogen-activated protein kinase kinase kinase 7 [Scaptodrosophila lebanonensis]